MRKKLNYKLVAIDMDGTLLNSKNEVSERTKVAIHKASDYITSTNNEDGVAKVIEKFILGIGDEDKVWH